MKSYWMNYLKLAATSLPAFGVANLLGMSAAWAEPSAQLIAAAKAEGQLTLMGLPRDWCNYGELVDDFKAKYGLKVSVLNPDAGSGDEVEAIRANKGNKGPQAPDAIDVGLSFAPKAKAEGLLAPYKVATWNTIPTEAKDADGYWYGDYYGVLSFEVNADLVSKIPTDWADLQKSDYASSVSLAGDARVSNQAILGVFAAGLSRANGDVAKAGDAGLQYFAQLNKSGNFVPVIGKESTLAQGTTPILIRWDYNALADRDSLKGNPKVQVVVPKTGVVAGMYAQAISAYAPHPNAAKLWMEYLYSDKGQLTWLSGYCHPIRFKDLTATHKIPADMMAKLPPAAAYEKAVFPTLDQQDTFNAVITKRWDQVVGANIK